MRAHLKLIGISLLAGFGGVLIGLACLHLYQDHTNLHALVNLELQRAQAAQKAAAPDK
jgi:hypothetical protein